MKKNALILIIVMLILALSLSLYSCSTPDGSGKDDGGKTNPLEECALGKHYDYDNDGCCDYCDITLTEEEEEEEEENTEPSIDDITSDILTISGDKITGSFKNSISSIDICDALNYPMSFGFTVSNSPTDPENRYDLVLRLEEGMNTFYVHFFDDSSDDVPIKTFTLEIYRNRTYTVVFDTDCDLIVPDQTVEEGGRATEPQIGERSGYEFGGWDYDFSSAVESDVVVNAIWVPLSNAISYTVNVYYTSLTSSGYALEETKTLYAAAGTEISLVPETIQGLVFNAQKSKISGTVEEGTNLVLNLYYDRTDCYLQARPAYGGSFGGGYYNNQPFYYGKTIEISAVPNLGYVFLGWYAGEELISTEASISLTFGSDVQAKFECVPELLPFTTSGDATTCVITGVKDKTVTKITVPDIVTGMGFGAFNGCSKLEELYIPFVGNEVGDPNNVNHVPFGYIFGTAQYQGGVATKQYYYTFTQIGKPVDATYYIPSTLKTVSVGGTSLHYGAFYNCKNITTVILREGITSIAEYSFMGCTSVTSITIPSTLKSIGNFGFAFGQENVKVNVTSLTAWLSINNGNTNFSTMYELYINGTMVTDVVIPAGITKIPGSAFRNVAGIQSVTIPAGVTEISYHAFTNCKNLKSVTMANDVTSIDSQAFAGCTSLTTVKLSEKLESIGNSAFCECAALEEIVIPDSVLYINSEAFAYCTGLKSVTLGKKVAIIGDGAFGGCTNLKKVINKSSLVLATGSESCGMVAYYATEIIIDE